MRRQVSTLGSMGGDTCRRVRRAKSCACLLSVIACCWILALAGSDRTITARRSSPPQTLRGVRDSAREGGRRSGRRKRCCWRLGKRHDLGAGAEAGVVGGVLIVIGEGGGAGAAQ